MSLNSNELYPLNETDDSLINSLILDRLFNPNRISCPWSWRCSSIVIGKDNWIGSVFLWDDSNEISGWLEWDEAEWGNIYLNESL